MRIYGMCEDLMGCGYHRIVAPLSALARHGHTVEISHQPPQNVLDWDIIQIQKFTMPELMPWLEYWTRPNRKGPRFVFDLDDDLYHLDPSNPAIRFYGQSPVINNLRRAMDWSHAVTFTTQYLATVCEPIQKHVGIFPNYIPDHLIKPYKWSHFQLGWQGGFSHQQDLEAVASVVNHFLVRYKKRINIIGQDYTALFANARHYPWGEYNKFMNTIRKRVSVGLAPIRPNHFNHCKSDIKLKEYAASGAVPVYPNTPPYSESPVVGYAYESLDALFGILEHLISDEMILNASIVRAIDSVKDQTHGRHAADRIAFYSRVINDR